MDNANPQSSIASAATAQLRDIHLPNSPNIWPPAPGWWLLATLLLFLGGWFLFKIIAAKKRKKRLQAILDTLKPIEKKLLNQPDNKGVSELNIFVRQLALMHFPQSKIASLSGYKWLTFLDESGKTKQFTQGAGKLLASAPYLPDHTTIDKTQAKALLKVVKDWLKNREIAE